MFSKALATGLAALAVGCGASRALPGISPPDAALDVGPAAADHPVDHPPPDAARSRSVDILFMIDNSSGMTSMQLKLAQQLHAFASALESLPGGMPDLHIAVVSSDMGAPGDAVSSIGCTTDGDRGVFQVAPHESCTSSGLQPGATFISDASGVANYTGSLGEVLTCIAPLGTSGCGFEHQLASVTRALGADGAPPPAENAGFLRPDAELAIFLLTNEDDCSAPPDTTLYSLNGGRQSVTNPLGPIANYRCNQFGHLCKDPTGPPPDVALPPPLAVPSDASGSPRTLALADCTSNDGPGGLVTPVETFVQQIQTLKSDPSRIVVAGIVGPLAPYRVAWLPPASPPQGTSGELWPMVEHSCGAAGGTVYGDNPGAQTATDGSNADPAVRVTQWLHALGGTANSVCDPSYAPALQAFAAAIGQHL